MTRYIIAILCAVALLGSGESVLAKSPPETITLDPVIFTDVNPCSGETHIVTLVWTVRYHDFELTDPARHHGVATLAGTITTNSGFTGRITQVDLYNGSGSVDAAGGADTWTNVTNGIARNDSGDMFAVHAALHVTVVDGEPRVTLENFRLECTG